MRNQLKRHVMFSESSSHKRKANQQGLAGIKLRNVSAKYDSSDDMHTLHEIETLDDLRERAT
jgi:hypothetical protein